MRPSRPHIFLLLAYALLVTSAICSFLYAYRVFHELASYPTLILNTKSDLQGTKVDIQSTRSSNFLGTKIHLPGDSNVHQLYGILNGNVSNKLSKQGFLGSLICRISRRIFDSGLILASDGKNINIYQYILIFKNIDTIFWYLKMSI